MSNNQDSGFSLVEILIAILISSIVGALLATTYSVHQRTHTAQQHVIDMQQNVRSALYFMTREIRMAGLDPQRSSDAKILTATKSRFEFTQDINDNGAGKTPGDGDTDDTNEHITFGFSTANDSKLDGIADAGSASLGRRAGAVGAPFQPIAENIHAIEFYYTLSDGTKTLAPSNSELDNISMVTITILARARIADSRLRIKKSYTTASGAKWNVDDYFKRRLFITDIKLKNLGL